MLEKLDDKTIKKALAAQRRRTRYPWPDLVDDPTQSYVEVHHGLEARKLKDRERIIRNSLKKYIESIGQPLTYRVLVGQIPGVAGEVRIFAKLEVWESWR